MTTPQLETQQKSRPELYKELVLMMENHIKASTDFQQSMSLKDEARLEELETEIESLIFENFCEWCDSFQERAILVTEPPENQLFCYRLCLNYGDVIDVTKDAIMCTVNL